MYEKKRNPSKICKKSQQAASGSKTRIPTSSSVTQDKCQCGRICKTVVASPTDTVNQNRTTFFTMERQPREKIKEGLRKIRHATGRRKSDGCVCGWGGIGKVWAKSAVHDRINADCTASPRTGRSNLHDSKHLIILY